MSKFIVCRADIPTEIKIGLLQIFTGKDAAMVAAENLAKNDPGSIIYVAKLLTQLCGVVSVQKTDVAE